jgi:hypothetical protein
VDPDEVEVGKGRESYRPYTKEGPLHAHPSTPSVPTLRELNRATLARQMLLDRAALPAPAAIERLAGLQTQWPKGPYISLWTRLRDFQRDDLSRAVQERPSCPQWAADLSVRGAAR